VVVVDEGGWWGGRSEIRIRMGGGGSWELGVGFGLAGLACLLKLIVAVKQSDAAS